MITTMQHILGYIPSKYYSDLLYDSTSKPTLQKSANGEKMIVNLKDRGVVFRVFDGQKFHEISTSLSEIHLLEDKVKKMVSGLVSKAQTITGKTQSVDTEELAQKLVNQCANIHEGENVVITGGVRG